MTEQEVFEKEELGDDEKFRVKVLLHLQGLSHEFKGLRSNILLIWVVIGFLVVSLVASGNLDLNALVCKLIARFTG